MPSNTLVKEWRGVFLGSVVAIPGEPPEAAVPKIKEYAAKRKKEDGKEVKVKVEITESEFRAFSGKVQLQAIELDSIIYTAQVKDEPDKILITSLSQDKRLTIRLTHMYSFEKRAEELPTHLQSNFKLIDRKPQKENIPKDTKLYSCLYLGFQVVSDDADALEKAYNSNKESRRGIQTQRSARRSMRLSIDTAQIEHQQQGTTVDEHNATLVVNQKSVRVVDSTTGETIKKFITSTVTKSTMLENNTVLAILRYDARINYRSCFFFVPVYTDGKDISDTINNLAQQVKTDEKALTDHEPFTPAPDAKREPSPPELFQLQVHRADLQAEKILGSGQFGEVYLAKQKCRSKAGNIVQVDRAVKTLKQGAGGNDKNEFLKEAMIMLAIGNHPNIVQMVGVAVQQAPWLCVLEYLPYGDMLGVLSSLKERKIDLENSQFLLIGLQLVDGLDHLVSRRLVHMDLAARNVLVAENSVCKIADFGMTMPYSEEMDLIRVTVPIKLAVKWSAPESVTKLIFSEKSDVWSWGVTMWEIYSYGAVPWKGETKISMIEKLKKGKRLLRPKPHCSNDVYTILLQSWEYKKEKRPTFKKLHSSIKRLLSRASFDVDKADIGSIALGIKKEKKPDTEEPENKVEDLSQKESYKIAQKATSLFQPKSVGREEAEEKADDIYGWGGMGHTPANNDDLYAEPALALMQSTTTTPQSKETQPQSAPRASVEESFGGFEEPAEHGIKKQRKKSSKQANNTKKEERRVPSDLYLAGEDILKQEHVVPQDLYEETTLLAEYSNNPDGSPEPLHEDTSPVSMKDLKKSKRSSTGVNDSSRSSDQPKTHHILLEKKKEGGFGMVLEGPRADYDLRTGIFVSKIHPDSPAAEAYPDLDVGMRVLAVNGQEVSHLMRFQAVALVKKSGATVALECARDEQGKIEATRLRKSRKKSARKKSMKKQSMKKTGTKKKSIKETKKKNPSDPSVRLKHFTLTKKGEGGFGMVLEGPRGPEDKRVGIYVSKIHEGTPASDAYPDLQVGMRVVSINGHAASTCTRAEAVGMVKSSGTSVELECKLDLIGLNQYIDVPKPEHQESKKIEPQEVNLQEHGFGFVTEEKAEDKEFPGFGE
eukprot:m.256355 g.256355  ORF g.256355 m.256355 type:complete len:1105 (+) comp16186_c0_seq23:215-3529(+)